MAQEDPNRLAEWLVAARQRWPEFRKAAVDYCRQVRDEPHLLLETRWVDRGSLVRGADGESLLAGAARRDGSRGRVRGFSRRVQPHRLSPPLCGTPRLRISPVSRALPAMRKGVRGACPAMPLGHLPRAVGRSRARRGWECVPALRRAVQPTMSWPDCTGHVSRSRKEDAR